MGIADLIIDSQLLDCYPQYSHQDSIVDLNFSEGDKLVFFNTGGANFDKNTISLNTNTLSIKYDATHLISIDINITSLSSAEIESNILVV